MSSVIFSKDFIGKKFKLFEHEVERGKIKEFCQAIGETNPIYFDSTEAKKAGYQDIPIPITFQTSIQFWGNPEIWENIESIGVERARILHMKEEYKYIQPIYAGKVIGQTEVTDIRTGKMDMVTFKTIFFNSKNEPCIEAYMSIVMRPMESAK